MKIVKSKSVREQVYEELKSLIINGKIAAGEKIIEVEYAKKFDVSRTPIREALRSLENEGLVLYAEKGGVIVKEISDEEIEEVYKIRVVLENLILKEIIEKEEVNFKNLEKIIADTQKLIDNDKLDTSIINLFSKFNAELYRLSELKYVSKLITGINQYVKRFRIYSVREKSRILTAHQEHIEIMKALKDKNLEKAYKVNKNHLLTSMEVVFNQIKNKNRI